jgi:glycine/D-amino acid oxidase-like deaminating enzyme
VTGRSSAKITTQHSLIYRHLIDPAGSDVPLSYPEANRRGAAKIRDWIETLQIDCDYEPRSAFTYTCDPSRMGDIRAEAEAAWTLGFNARVFDKAPLPFPTAGALEFRDQAQFNPARHLVGLAMAVQARGGQIFEQSRAMTLEPADQWSVGTGKGQVMADHVVIATNITVKSPWATPAVPSPAAMWPWPSAPTPRRRLMACSLALTTLPTPSASSATPTGH